MRVNLQHIICIFLERQGGISREFRPCSRTHSRLQVLDSVKDPLQNIVQGREAEVVYAALSNFLVLARRYPGTFGQLYSDFYCRQVRLGGTCAFWPIM